MITPELVAAAQAAHAKAYPLGPFVSVILAQWAVESGWGKHQSGKNNFFGIKANTHQIERGNATQRLTNEYVHGRMVQITDWFANYDTLEEGIFAHTSLLLRPHYKACQEAKTVKDYCYALQKCGYATAPNYAEVLLSVIKGSNLEQYDPPPPAKLAKKETKDGPPT